MQGRCAAAPKKIYELLKSDKNQQKKRIFTAAAIEGWKCLLGMNFNRNLMMGIKCKFCDLLFLKQIQLFKNFTSSSLECLKSLRRHKCMMHT